MMASMFCDPVNQRRSQRMVRWADKVSQWRSAREHDTATDDELASELDASAKLRKRRLHDAKPLVPVTSAVWLTDQAEHTQMVRSLNQRNAAFWQRR